MNGECNATNVQGKNYNLHKLQGGGHVPQCPIAGDATASMEARSEERDGMLVTGVSRLVIMMYSGT